jgi:hypothetical protein
MDMFLAIEKVTGGLIFLKLNSTTPQTRLIADSGTESTLWPTDRHPIGTYTRLDRDMNRLLQARGGLDIIRQITKKPKLRYAFPVESNTETI